MTEARSWEDMRVWCAELLERATGEGVEVWADRVADSGIDAEPVLRT